MIKIRLIKQIQLQDWDNLVQKTYGKPYSFQQQEGCKSRGIENIETNPDWDYDYENESIPEVINGEEMGVKFEVWLARDPNALLNPSDEELADCGYYWGKTEKEKMEWKNDNYNKRLFWGRNFYPHPNMIANDLCKKGLLEEGEYQIEIDW